MFHRFKETPRPQVCVGQKLAGVQNWPGWDASLLQGQDRLILRPLGRPVGNDGVQVILMPVASQRFRKAGVVKQFRLTQDVAKGAPVPIVP